jgi:broad specificity phosphatase PhoE
MTDCGCEKYHIKILFVRHGFSCSNARQYHHGTSGRFGKAFMKDPPLTNYAIAEITNVARPWLKRNKIKPDIVLSSTLLRAEQTAHFLFPKKTVYVVPFIREHGFGKDNVARKPREQLMKFAKAEKDYNKFAAKLKMPGVKQSIHAPIDYHYVKNHWDEAQQVNYDKFIMWLEQKIVPRVVSSQKKEYLIAVVGHSAFMRKNIETELKRKGEQDNKKLNNPDNVAMVDLNFCVRTNPSLGHRRHKREWELHPIDPKSCRCRKFHSLRDVPHRRSKLCNGVVYRGFPIPPKKFYEKIGGGANCPTGWLY